MYSDRWTDKHYPLQNYFGAHNTYWERKRHAVTTSSPLMTTPPLNQARTNDIWEIKSIYESCPLLAEGCPHIGFVISLRMSIFRLIPAWAKRFGLWPTWAQMSYRQKWIRTREKSDKKHKKTRPSRSIRCDVWIVKWMRYPTDQPTDQPTDTASFIGTWSRLKMGLIYN